MKEDRPSGTAHLIAQSLVFLSRDPKFEKIISARTVEASLWFLEACADDTKIFLSLANQRWFRGLINAIDCHTIPGILFHYALRKHRLEEIARRSLEAGIEQVVILGAGFDPLALRLHQEYPQANFWELDHPATQRVKGEALAKRNLPAANMRLIPQNLSGTSLENALLSEAHYRPEADTLFIAEGLLMYLSPPHVQEILRVVRGYSGAGSRFAFTFLEPQHDGRVNFQHSSRIVDLWLRRRGEEFLWGLERAEAAVYLLQNRFHLSEIITPEELRERYLPQEKSAQTANGDIICIADVMLKEKEIP